MWVTPILFDVELTYLDSQAFVDLHDNVMENVYNTSDSNSNTRLQENPVKFATNCNKTVSSRFLLYCFNFTVYSYNF